MTPEGILKMLNFTIHNENETLYKKDHPTVGGATPWQVNLGCIKQKLN